jgi:hypothetical protein
MEGAVEFERFLELESRRTARMLSRRASFEGLSFCYKRQTGYDYTVVCSQYVNKLKGRWTFSEADVTIVEGKIIKRLDAST